jgi:hypothetical protein
MNEIGATASWTGQAESLCKAARDSLRQSQGSRYFSPNWKTMVVPSLSPIVKT